MRAAEWRQVLSTGLAQQQRPFGYRQWQVFHHLLSCHTLAAGLARYQCEQCGYEREVHRSCRDRHCPCCQSGSIRQWCQARSDDVLPVRYFHLVFTLPYRLNGLAGLHPSVLYRCLFQAAWQSLSGLLSTRKNLDGQPGMMSVLHSWGQQLMRHPHLHCVIPGGVLKGGQWQSVSGDYLLPVKALSVRFRGRLVSLLRTAARKGLLFRATPERLKKLFRTLMQTDWVVYNKAVTYGHHRLTEYLGRYTRKTALNLSRLSGFDGQALQLRYRDYRDGEQKQMTLSAAELVRRLSLHILPKGLMRVRYFGFMANAIRRRKLAQIRRSLQVTVAPKTTATPAERSVPVCPDCGENHWHYMGFRLSPVMPES